MTFISDNMSILSSTGLGGEHVVFLDLYKRKDDFYNELENYWNWSPEYKVTVYNEKEFNFLYQYITRFSFSDQYFVEKVIEIHNQIEARNSLYDIMDNDSTIDWKSVVVHDLDIDSSSRMSKANFRKAKQHGFRKPAKFF